MRMDLIVFRMENSRMMVELVDKLGFIHKNMMIKADSI